MDCDLDHLLHGIPLGSQTLRVSVDVPMQPDIDIPIPTEEIQTVLDAQGTHVAWPIDLVIFSSKVYTLSFIPYSNHILEISLLNDFFFLTNAKGIEENPKRKE